MRVLLRLPVLFLLSLLVLHAVYADKKTAFEVVGFGECADCKANNFKTSQAFSGLQATIDCKLKTGEIKRVGASELDNQGKFKISLPQDIIVQDGQSLKHDVDCYAQLHSAAAIPCPSHNGLSKISFNKNNNAFAPTKPLKFSTALCTSKILWPHYKYPPHPWKKIVPKIPMPPPIVYKHPVIKPIFPPPVVYKHPFIKPILPPPVVYKHPFIKPMLPPPVVYRHPFIKPTLPPPVVFPPHPPMALPPLPPFYKKPCPPLPKLPPLPQLPPKYYFKHPKYGYVPPTPPQSISQP